MKLLVSHDAGGAELLSSQIRSEPGDYRFVLAGPATGIFRRKLGEIENWPLEQGLRGATELICGTSWQSDLEFAALGRARELGIPSRAFLDHWVNYRDRFARHGVVRLPDELWVADEYAQAIAISQFPGTPVRMVGNPYLRDITAELASLPATVVEKNGKLSVLYVCEPVSEVAGLLPDNIGPGYDEHEALRRFLDGLAPASDRIDRVVVRPHPAEPAGKYDWALRNSPLSVVLGGGRKLLEEIVASDIVVGCESMAMVIGLVAGKRVITSIPPHGRPCSLPFREIERFDPAAFLSA